MIEVLKAKIHGAIVTDANINYEGSITIYEPLMQSVGIIEYEKVLVVDVQNANRFETYVIKGHAKENPICLNGAAARLVTVGDRIIIMAFQYLDEGTVSGYSPRVIFLDEANEIKTTK
ncbi:MAG: aspartate 1-decarboxylase [Oscillospiraceae bacterium]|nr:aspartate 1-decarboxylase [Oscillospiraceae bacterium]